MFQGAGKIWTVLQIFSMDGRATAVSNLPACCKKSAISDRHLAAARFSKFSCPGARRDSEPVPVFQRPATGNIPIVDENCVAASRYGKFKRFDRAMDRVSPA